MPAEDNLLFEGGISKFDKHNLIIVGHEHENDWRKFRFLLNFYSLINFFKVFEIIIKMPNILPA